MSEPLGVTVATICRSCGNRFDIGSTNGVVHFKQKYKDENGHSILLTYYDCPECGRRHFVQADDEVSIKLLRSISKAFIHIAYVAKSGKPATVATLREKYNRKCSQLNNHRFQLMRDWTGRHVVEVGTNSEQVYDLEFSV